MIFSRALLLAARRPSATRAAARLSSSAAAAAGRAPAQDPNDPLPSLARALFEGRLATASVVPYPRTAAGARDDLREIVASVESFYNSGTNDAAANDATASIPEKTRAGLRGLGAYGLQVPQEFGGIGADNASYGRLSEVLGANDLGLSIHLGAHQSSE
jgi:alkylation response protein AidB-like acyl-CoA dehydrogenase